MEELDGIKGNCEVCIALFIPAELCPKIICLRDRYYTITDQILHIFTSWDKNSMESQCWGDETINAVL